MEDEKRAKSTVGRVVAVALLLFAGAGFFAWTKYGPAVKEMAADADRIKATAKGLFTAQKADLDSIRHQYTEGRWVMVLEWHPLEATSPEEMGALMDRVWPQLKPHVPERYTTTVLAVPKPQKGLEVSTKSSTWHRYQVYRVYGQPLSDDS